MRCFVRFVPAAFALLVVTGPSLAQSKEPPPKERVTVRSGERTVSGDLWLPAGDGPFSAVLLIPGGGPGKEAPPKPGTPVGFQTCTALVPHLTGRGIAALLVIPRGGPEVTAEDRAGDVLAALAFLQKRQEIDRGKIGVCGHSVGGVIAPLVAARSEQVAFLVLLAGPCASMPDLVVALLERFLRENGASATEIAEFLRAERQVLTSLREGKSLEPQRPALLKLYESLYPRLPADQRKRFGSAKDFAKVMVAQKMAVAANPAERFLATYDPKSTLQKVGCPVLALFAEKDVKVSLTANREPLVRSLPKGGDHTVMLIPGADHLFQNVNNGAAPQFVPGFTDVVAGWILTRVSGGRRNGPR